MNELMVLNENKMSQRLFLISRLLMLGTIISNNWISFITETKTLHGS